MKVEIDASDIKRMASEAWTVRGRARLLGRTAVGAAVLSSDGEVWVGCNIEHQFRSHDIHAETNAIGAMIAGGSISISAILVVAERERFTPCGACMDWIFEFADGRCEVLFQSAPDAPMVRYLLGELMPFYPR